jgi:hypothetical protein
VALKLSAPSKITREDGCACYPALRQRVRIAFAIHPNYKGLLREKGEFYINVALAIKGIKE